MRYFSLDQHCYPYRPYHTTCMQSWIWPISSTVKYSTFLKLKQVTNLLFLQSVMLPRLEPTKVRWRSNTQVITPQPARHQDTSTQNITTYSTTLWWKKKKNTEMATLFYCYCYYEHTVCAYMLWQHCIVCRHAIKVT